MIKLSVILPRASGIMELCILENVQECEIDEMKGLGWNISDAGPG